MQHIQAEFWQYVWNVVVFSTAISWVIGGFIALLAYFGVGRIAKAK